MSGTLDGVSVLGVADHAIVRAWIEVSLRDRGAVVHLCTSSAHDLADWSGGCPIASIDIAVVDLDIRGGAGVEVALALRELRAPDWPWIALAHRDDPVQRAAVRVARAASLLVQAVAHDVLATAVELALRSGHGSSTRARQLAYARQFYGLNDDELACVDGVLEEKTNARIAKDLDRSVAHVARTISIVQEKLGVTTRQGIAARIAAGAERGGEGTQRNHAIDRSVRTDRSIDRQAAID